ncbi:MAG TPA: ATP-grasp domain-containing protein [Rectinemataceae bacterium]|nr:ATP-grasp domain-containing protein [Rectinemataceae bacterium]
MRRIGILGGGQLGRMAMEEARKYLAEIEVLTPDYPSPGAELADFAHIGELDDYEGLLEFGAGVEALSWEIESVGLEALYELERRGKAVLPGAAVLEAIQDKASQKAILEAKGIPTARWLHLESAPGGGPDSRGLEAAAEALGGFPIVQKARRGGSDGRGVQVLGSAGSQALKMPSIAEERIDFAKELAVVVARGPEGSTAVYPCVEMVFDERANLCDSVLAPAREGEAIRSRAERLALDCVAALDGWARERTPGGSGAVGVFGVEMFLTRDGEVLVNEIAPRPHNSGHFSIEACPSSQFDQYIRILLGLPLGSAELLRPAMMVNIIGEPGQTGEPVYLGLDAALAIPGVAVHLYGKRELRPFRKMGHLTAIGRSTKEAMDRAQAARAMIRVVAR